MTTRCKFLCESVTKTQPRKEAAPLFTATFRPVWSDSPENKAFFDATPFGELKVGQYREDAFQPGKEYFIDITVAEPVEA